MRKAISSQPASFVVFALCAWACSGSAAPAAEGSTLPPPVKESLARFAEVKTLTLRWTEQSLRSAATRARLAGSLKDLSRLQARYLAWQRGNLFDQRYIGTLEWQDGPGTQRQEQAFDGRLLIAGRPYLSALNSRKSEPPLYIITSTSKMNPRVDFFNLEELERMGLHVPQATEELVVAKALSSQVLFLLKNGGSLHAVAPAQLDDHSVLRVAVLRENPWWKDVQIPDFAAFEKSVRETSKRVLGQDDEGEVRRIVAETKRAMDTTPRTLLHVFYLDPQLGYAVRRWEQRNEDGRLRMQTNCTEHEKLLGYDIWLPRKCRTDEFLNDGKISEAANVVELLELVEISTKPVPAELFSPKPTIPGSSVTDRSEMDPKDGSGAVVYTVPAKPEDLDQVIAEARSLAHSDGRWSKYRTIILATNALALVGLLVYLLIRHRKKAAQ